MPVKKKSKKKKDLCSVYTFGLFIELCNEVGVVKISNHSEFTVEISLVPINFRRKIKNVLIVPPQNYRFLENADEFDVTQFYWRFVQ